MIRNFHPALGTNISQSSETFDLLRHETITICCKKGPYFYGFFPHYTDYVRSITPVPSSVVTQSLFSAANRR